MVAAGKSGTTTRNIDVWFVGYTPYYTAGIWAGCDENQSLNDSETGQYNGGTSFHKDIWRKIMNRVHEELAPVSEFEIPDGIVQLEVCRKSGMLPTYACRADHRAGSSAVYTEYFDMDNIPLEACAHHLPWGGILAPAGDRGKYTDDTYYSLAEDEEDHPENNQGTENYDGQPPDVAIIIDPAVDIASTPGPGGSE